MPPACHRAVAVRIGLGKPASDIPSGVSGAANSCWLVPPAAFQYRYGTPPAIVTDGSMDPVPPVSLHTSGGASTGAYGPPGFVDTIRSMHWVPPFGRLTY